MTNAINIKDDEHVDPFVEYYVVKNIHQQYSVLPTAKEIPAGWETNGVIGELKACLEWIETNWAGPSL
ncbi:MbtH family NRPS accessory protein [Chitinophaga sp. Hz27]|uniref:MbtH family NRPS accessory protein n=1 Tax=Chitinophaga sp. Hz27 TaxID=3347169 RepID=UPI0035E0BDAA